MAADVMVFAPVPVLTVTVEQQGDTVELHVHPGGQGVWQARMIASLGCPVTLCLTAGGEIGSLLRRLLPEEGVTVRAVKSEAQSGWYVHDRRDGQRRVIAEHPGAPMVRHDLDELYNIALIEGLQARLSVLSGPAHRSVLGTDVYRRLAADLGTNGCLVVADLSGDYLDAVLASGVTFLKVSHEELLRDGRAADDSVDALVAAGRALCAAGADTVLVSRADEPALAFINDRIVRVVVPTLQVTDPRGAGDSMTAGVAAVLARGGGLEDAIRTGAAAGALNVTRHGLGTGRADAVGSLVARVRLEPL